MPIKSTHSKRENPAIFFVKIYMWNRLIDSTSPMLRILFQWTYSNGKCSNIIYKLIKNI